MRTLQAGPRQFATIALVAVATALSTLSLPAKAQDGWPWEANSNRDNNRRSPADRSNSYDQDRPVTPRGGGAPATYQEGPIFQPEIGVERTDLSPVIASDGSGLPHELWHGIDVGTLEQLLASIDIPPHSPALHGLWLRLMTAPPPVSAPGSGENAKFEAVRLEALYRSGLTADMARLMQGSEATTNSGLTVLLARAAIIEGRDDDACGQTQNLLRDISLLPKSLASEAVLISGYCVARTDNANAAGVAAGFAREQGVAEGAGLVALDAIAHGSRPKLAGAWSISLIDYKLLRKAGLTDVAGIVPKAAPALLVMLSRDQDTTLPARLAAGEAAARLNAIGADTLADLYRAGSMAEVSAAASTGTPAYRASLFLAAEAERSLPRKAQLIRTYLDDAGQADLYWPALRTMSSLVLDMRPDPQVDWFAETAIEVLLAAGEPQAASSWLSLTGPGGSRATGQLDHWAALIEISDKAGGRHSDTLGPLEHRALHGGFTPDQLHRIVTVLDALDYQIPLPLWDAASNTPQPATGHLPQTGVLSKLLEAAKAREFGRTVLLAMNALGPRGAGGAHMIALGDAIRALKSAGLEAEARRIAFEALFPTWPRRVSG